jgi:hypothetical protein
MKDRMKSKLIKSLELAELFLYTQIPPYAIPTKRRETIVNKHRNALTNNSYFKKFIEPLVLRLYDHASKSGHVKRHPCSYGASTFVYTIRGHLIYPILTMGSKEQLYEICEKECTVCPTVVYSPFAVAAGLIELAMFETSRLVSRIKKFERRN